MHHFLLRCLPDQQQQQIVSERAAEQAKQRKINKNSNFIFIGMLLQLPSVLCGTHTHTHTQQNECKRSEKQERLKYKLITKCRTEKVDRNFGPACKSSGLRCVNCCNKLAARWQIE